MRLRRHPKPGKWIVTVDAEDIDAVWAKVRQALLAGNLGPSAKTRTVRRVLTGLGFRNLRYKTDEETLAGGRCET